MYDKRFGTILASLAVMLIIVSVLTPIAIGDQPASDIRAGLVDSYDGEGVWDDEDPDEPLYVIQDDDPDVFAPSLDEDRTGVEFSSPPGYSDVGWEEPWIGGSPDQGETLHFITESRNDDAGDYVTTSYRDATKDVMDEELYFRYEKIPTPEIENVTFDSVEIRVESPVYTDYDSDTGGPLHQGTHESFLNYSVFVKGGTYGEWTHVGETEYIPEDEYEGVYDDPLPSWGDDTDPNDVVTGLNSFVLEDVNPGQEIEFKTRMNLAEGMHYDEYGYEEGYTDAYTTVGTSAPNVTSTLQEATFDVVDMSFDYEGDELLETDELTVEYEVENVGDLEGNDTLDFSVIPEYDDEPIGETEPSSEELDDMAPGETYESEFTWQSEWGDGNNDFTAWVYPSEPGEAGNESFTVGADDFYEVEIDSTNSPVKESENLSVESTIFNLGSDSAAEQDITLLDFDGNTVDGVEDFSADGRETRDDDAPSTTVEELIWETDFGDADEGVVTVESEDDYDVEDVVIDPHYVLDLDIVDTNTPITENETVEIITDIDNPGSEQGEETVYLHVEDFGVVDDAFVSLESEESTSVTFEWETEWGDAGDHLVEVYAEEYYNPDEEVITVEASHFYVIDIHQDEYEYSEGEEAEIGAEVENIGSADGSLVMMRFRVFEEETDEEVESDLDVLSVESGTTEDIYFIWSTTLGDAGDYYVEIDTDLSDAGSGDRADLEVTGSQYFDVDIIDTNTPTEGETLNVTVEVNNIGSEEGEQTVELLNHSGVLVPSEPEREHGDSIPSWTGMLDEGESTTIELAWDTWFGDAGTDDITVQTLDVDGEPLEIDMEEVEIEATDHFEIDIIEVDEGVSEGEILTITADVNNIGSDDGTQDINLYDFDGDVVDTVASELGPGDTSAVELTWDTDYGDAGADDVKVTTEDYYQYDWSEFDDRGDYPWNYDEALAELEPDAFLSVEIEDVHDPVQVPNVLEVDVSVENIGSGATTDEHHVSLNNFAGDEVDMVYIDDLEGGGSENVTLAWDTVFGDADNIGTDDIEVASGDYEEVDEAVLSEATVDPGTYLNVDITGWNEEVHEGEDLIVYAELTNEGLGEAEDEDVEFLIDDGDVKEDWMSVDVDPSSVKEIEFTWDTSVGDMGEYTASIDSLEPDYEDVETGIDESPYDEVDVEVLESLEVVIEEIEYQEVVEGETFTVNVTVLNQGPDTLESDVYLYVPGWDEGLVDTYPDLSIGGGQTDEVSLHWDTEMGDAGMGDIDVRTEHSDPDIDYADSWVETVTVHTLRPPEWMEIDLIGDDHELIWEHTLAPAFNVYYSYNRYDDLDTWDIVVEGLEVDDDSTPSTVHENVLGSGFDGEVYYYITSVVVDENSEVVAESDRSSLGFHVERDFEGGYEEERISIPQRMNNLDEITPETIVEDIEGDLDTSPNYLGSTGSVSEWDRSDRTSSGLADWVGLEWDFEDAVFEPGESVTLVFENEYTWDITGMDSDDTITIEEGERPLVYTSVPYTLADRTGDGELRAGDIVTAIEGDLQSNDYIFEIVKPDLETYDDIYHYDTLRDEWLGENFTIEAGDAIGLMVQEDVTIEWEPELIVPEYEHPTDFNGVDASEGVQKSDGLPSTTTSSEASTDYAEEIQTSEMEMEVREGICNDTPVQTTIGNKNPVVED